MEIEQRITVRIIHHHWSLVPPDASTFDDILSDTSNTTNNTIDDGSSCCPPRMKIMDRIEINQRQFILEDYWQPSDEEH
jgi:hypothetical protein